MKSLRGALGFLAVLAAASPVGAITWTGVGAVLPGTTLEQRPELAGQVIATHDIVINNLAAADVIVRNYVVRADTTGTLDFYFQVIGNGTVTQPVPAMLVTGFATVPQNVLDVDQLRDGNFAPDLGISRFSQELAFTPLARGTGIYQINPGQVTAPLFIRTDATSFDQSGTIAFIGDAAVSGTFAPAASNALIPEPASLSLLALAVGGLAVRLGRT